MVSRTYSAYANLMHTLQVGPAIAIEESCEIDMDSAVHKFCVSWFSIRVCSVGTILDPVPGTCI